MRVASPLKNAPAWLLGALGAILVVAFALAQPVNPGTVNFGTYPPGSLPVTASATFTTGTQTATLPAAPNRTTYVCGFVITSGGTSAAAVANATITGTISGTLNFAYVFVSTGQGILGVALPQCVPGSAVNTAVVVNSPAGGAGTVGAVSAWGFQL